MLHHIAVYVFPAGEHAHLTESLRRISASVRSYDNEAALMQALVSAPQVDVIVTALRDARGCSLVPFIRRVHARAGSVAIVAYASLSAGSAADIVDAAQAGLSSAALRGYDDISTVVRRVGIEAVARRVAATAIGLVDRRLSAVTRPLIRFCLERAHAAPTVEQVALAFGVRRKTIAARLAAEALPPASAVIGWGRVLLAAHLIEYRMSAVEQVGFALGFESGTALRHMIMRYTGLRAGEIRARGGLTALLPLFAASVMRHGQASAHPGFVRRNAPCGARFRAAQECSVVT